MRNNTKKGFTLVELLVVIAILAILATVSVVGYTAFIERANVAADQNEVTQLNHFLAVLKSDNSSKFFNKDLNEWNVREATKEILDMVGWGELNPRSGENGYNVYFDLDKQEYILAKDTDIRDGNGQYSPLMSILGHAAPEGGKHLGNSLNSRFFLASTAGNAFANFVEKFYNLGVEDGEYKGFDGNDVEDWRSEAGTLGSDYEDVKNFVNDASVANGDVAIGAGEGDNKDCIYPDNTHYQNPTNLMVKDKDGNWVVAEGKSPVKEGGELVIPDDAEYIPVDNLDTNNVTIVTNKTPEDIASKVVSEKKDVEGATEGTTPEVTVRLGNGVTIHIGKQVVEVEVEASGAKVTIEFNVVIPDASKPELNIECTYSNPMTSFDGCIMGGSENKYDVIKGVGHIAWENGVTITLGATNFVGKNPAVPATGTEGIEWTSSVGTVNVVDNVATLVVDSVTKEEDIPKTITFTATKDGVTANYTVEVVYLKSIDYTIDGSSVTTFAEGLTLVYGENGKDTFNLAQVIGTPSKEGTSIVFAPAVTIADNDNFTYEAGVLNATDVNIHGEYALTINTEGYPHLKKDITLDVFNVENLSFVADHDNHVYVGDDNAITLGDLFAETGKEIPAGAMVCIYNVYGDSKFTFTESTLGKSDLAKANLYVLNADWATTPVEFKGGAATLGAAGQYKAAVTIVYPDEKGNYIRVAENHELLVVDGVNVTSFTQLNGTTNNILYGDIEMSSTDKVLTLSKDKTLYGAGYSMDMTGYKDEGTPVLKADGTPETFHLIGLNKDVPLSTTDKALITLKGATLNNVNIVGEVYVSSKLIYQDPEKFAYGASLVWAEGGSTIVDCYLANTRSPLVTTGAVTVEDTIIFGGNYANVDVRNGTTLTLKGNVTTINQMIDGVTPDTAGLGIAVDMFANKNNTKIVVDSGCTLKQYNYIKQADMKDKDGKDRLPILTYTMTALGMTDDINVFMTTELNKIFTEDAYKTYLDTDDNSVKYLNTGIVFMNGVKVTVWGFDKTNDATGVPTGDGKQVSGLNNYIMATTSAVRSKYGANAEAKMFIWTPDPSKHTVDNAVPAELLPASYLPK